MESETRTQQEQPDAATEGAVADEAVTDTADEAATDSVAERGSGAGSRGLRGKTVRDMLLSMAVITAGAFFFFLFLPNDSSQDPVREVGYEVEANSASRAAPYELLAPEGLPEEWRATSVRYQAQSDHGALWRVGFMDPDNEYATVAQADGAAAPFIADLSHHAQDTGETVRIGGEDWQRYTGPKYDALVREGADGTTLVTGTATAERLEYFAGTLEPRGAADD